MNVVDDVRPRKAKDFVAAVKNLSVESIGRTVGNRAVPMGQDEFSLLQTTVLVLRARGTIKEQNPLI